LQIANRATCKNDDMHKRTSGIVSLSIAQITLGTLGVCVLESAADSISIVFYRCAIGAILLLAFCHWRGSLSGIIRLPAKTLFLAMLSSVLMIVNWIFFFEGIRRTNISTATIVFHVQPLIVVVLGAVYFRERLKPIVFIWILIAFAGLVLATGFDLKSEFKAQYVSGLFFTLGAALSYAHVTLIAKGISHIKSHQLTLIQCTCGAIMLAPFLPLSPLDVTMDQWGWLSVIGAVHTGIVYILLYSALPKLSTPLIAVLLYLYPASAVMFDALTYKHDISLQTFIGLSLIILASLGVTLRWGRRQASISPKRI